MQLALITKDNGNSKKISRVGQKVQIIRSATSSRSWIKLECGREIVYLNSWLHILEGKKNEPTNTRK